MSSNIKLLKTIKTLNSYYLEEELINEIIKIISPIWQPLGYDNVYEKLFYFQYWCVSRQYPEIITNDLINELYLLHNEKIKQDKFLYIPSNFWFNRNAGLALPPVALSYNNIQPLLNFNHPISEVKWVVEHAFDEQD